MSENISPRYEKIVITDIVDFQRKVTFADKDVRKIIAHFVSTLFDLKNYSDAPLSEMLGFLYAASTEMTIQYDPTINPEKVYTGDVVVCNFGKHVDGEVSGPQVNALVCDVSEDNVVYLIPITKQQIVGDVKKYMPIVVNRDVFYNAGTHFKSGTLLLQMGKYVRVERIRRIVGTVSPEYYSEVIHRLHKSLDFLNELPEVENPGTFPVEEIQPSPVQDPPIPEGTPTGDPITPTGAVPEPEAPPAPKAPKKKSSSSAKKPSYEAFLRYYLQSQLEYVDNSAPALKTAKDFLELIHFKDELGLIEDALAGACELNRITYQSVVKYLKALYPLTETHIKEVIVDYYKTWLEGNPQITEQYPNTSITTLLTVFAKKYNGSK